MQIWFRKIARLVILDKNLGNILLTALSTFHFTTATYKFVSHKAVSVSVTTHLALSTVNSIFSAGLHYSSLVIGLAKEDRRPLNEISWLRILRTLLDSRNLLSFCFTSLSLGYFSWDLFNNIHIFYYHIE